MVSMVTWTLRSSVPLCYDDTSMDIVSSIITKLLPLSFPGCMLCFGQSSFFRFNHPEEAYRMKSIMPQGGRVTMQDYQLHTGTKLISMSLKLLEVRFESCKKRNILILNNPNNVTSLCSLPPYFLHQCSISHPCDVTMLLSSLFV